MSLFDDEKHNVLEQLKSLGAVPEDTVVNKTGWHKMIPNEFKLFRSEVYLKGKKQLRIKAKKEQVYLGRSLIVGGVALLIYFVQYQNIHYNTVIIPIVVAIVGVVLAFYSKDFTFDKKYRRFWMGKIEIRKMKRMDKEKLLCLDQIYALQILSKSFKHANEKGDGYTFNFELNLVLDDGKRINLMDDSDRWYIEESARKIAEFLEIPIWNGIL